MGWRSECQCGEVFFKDFDYVALGHPQTRKWGERLALLRRHLSILEADHKKVGNELLEKVYRSGTVP